MNYQRIYNQIVERAKKQNRTKQNEIYYEIHHIKPKCLNGVDDKKNLVYLTPKEHFLCHLLLVEIYPNEPKLKQALWLMAIGKRSKIKHKVSSKTYERLKIENSKLLKNQPKSKETKIRMSNSKKGIKQSKETIRKRSESLKGKPKPKGFGIGRKHSSFTKEKMKLSKLGKKKPKISESRKGKKYPNQSLAMKGKGNKKIFCPELNKEFESINNAGKILDINPNLISGVLNKRLKNTHKLTFQYL